MRILKRSFREGSINMAREMNQPLTAEQVAHCRESRSRCNAALADSHELLRAQRDEALREALRDRMEITRQHEMSNRLGSQNVALMDERDAAKRERDETRVKIAGLEIQRAEIHQVLPGIGFGSDLERTNQVIDILSADPLNVGKAVMEIYVCAICGGPAKWEPKEQVWRHAGGALEDGFLAQSFCDKYGYPIKVRALSAAMKGMK